MGAVSFVHAGCQINEYVDVQMDRRLDDNSMHLSPFLRN